MDSVPSLILIYIFHHRKHARKFAEQANDGGLKLCGFIQSRGQSNCLFFKEKDSVSG